MHKKRSFTTAFILLFLVVIILTKCKVEDDRAGQEQQNLQQYLELQGYTDVEPTVSGLYHVVMQEGEGESPVESDLINIEYVGSLVDGNVFETTNYDLAVSRGISREDKIYGPARFRLSSIGIQGLREGIKLMKEGGTSRIIIPSNLAFGSQDFGIIPPYSTLIYDVDLLDVISDPVEHEEALLNQFLEDNDITDAPTESGIYYLESVAGTGDLPANDATITLLYRGYLLDGRLFSEAPMADPFVLSLDSSFNIIPGFLEGIKKMREDGKAMFIIPWYLGYGSEGSDEGIIPPYSTLVFEVDVLSIQ